ncbi:MAG TPA: hypothetical protein VMZ53_18980, partial [Kofleriaceae bacterium]|nr:hypothetical protein [Kofleriaceae bacterium]
MRHALLALPLLAGCLIESPSGDDTYYPPPGGGSGSGWGSGYGGSDDYTDDYGCHLDTDCGTGYVCARDRECLAPSSVRIIHVNWTVKGQVPSDASCSHSPSLSITFGDPLGDLFGFAPVPCKAGRYTIDKFPTRFDRVELTRQ